MTNDFIFEQVGAVAAMTRIRDASKVAREVLISTKVSLLVGEGATEFAKSRGFDESNLNTNESYEKWQEWLNKKCQPNFRLFGKWIPDPTKSCGPYKPNRVDGIFKKMLFTC